MPPQPDEADIRKRVTGRYRRRFRFAVHLFLTLPALAFFALIGESGAMAIGPGRGGTMFAAGCMFMIWLSSVFIHFAWLLFSELSERAVQREIDRQWQLASLSYDKPKRGVSLLSDDGELAEAPDEDSSTMIAAKH